MSPISVKMRREILTSSSLVAESPFCSSLFCCWGSLFTGAHIFEKPKPIRITSDDLSFKETVAQRLVLASSLVPAVRNVSLRHYGVKLFGEKGLQQIAILCGAAAFSNTINELLVPDIPPEVEEYANVVLDGTGWNIGAFRSSFRKAVSEHSLAKDKSLSLSLSDLRRRCTSPDLQSPGKFGDTLQVPGMNPVTNGRRRTDYGNTISKPKKAPSNPEGKAPYRTLSFDIPRPSDKDRPRSTRYSTAQFKGGAVKKTMEVASQAAKANQIISTTLKGFPHTTSSLNKWIQENFGFLPRYLTNIHSLDMKRYLCMILNLLLFTSSDFNTSGHPYLMRRSDKFILGFIYFRSTSNNYLASHFAKLALDNRADSNMLAKAFERNHGWSGDDSNIPTDFLDLSQLLTAKIATRNVDHYILSMKLMAASRNNPWAVLEVVSLLGLFGLLQRLTAVLDDELGLELEVEKTIQANVKEVLGLNVGKTSANIDSPPFQDKSSNGLLWGGSIRF
ncbi:hypothetical protein HDU79_009656 [Rhizoclosmatium sp. JEL0117]|nr:hypothetical protein HDU79_009656 [Rhizoclosmatium sp. JEL0117]